MFPSEYVYFSCFNIAKATSFDFQNIRTEKVNVGKVGERERALYVFKNDKNIKWKKETKYELQFYIYDEVVVSYEEKKLNYLDNCGVEEML
jgi:hypothetical protein